MPRKPKHPCAYPGCPELVEHGARYCPEHQVMVNKDYERYGRDREAKKRYGYQWRKIRARQLAAFPLCERCKTLGRVTPATLVHHKIPLTQGGTNDPGNLQSLCQSCHSKIHAEHGDRWGSTRSREGDDESP